MVGLFNKLKNAGAGTSSPGSKDSAHKKKDEATPELTPLEKMLQNAGPIREDGNDKFFGLENFGNTCYCNSIVQALYYSETFRENVLKYPPSSSPSPSSTPNGDRPKVNVMIREPPNPHAANTQKGAELNRKQHRGGAAAQPQPGTKPEDRPDSPEYKKKQAMLKGPILELKDENPAAYGMGESTFTGMKDLFQALIESQSRTGVLSPQRFLEIFKKNNEMFQNSMHQDAHEFYGLVLNDIISNVDVNAKRTLVRENGRDADGLSKAMENVISQSNAMDSPLGPGWVKDIFEGVLTSETKCLTCETASQRDETFLDLSIDLEEHSSVTSCLSKFSREEMLCERNKFHCDHCGGLQEAEKRMKIHRLPKVLAFHLKRFKYTEDFTRLQKLFHRVVYPYHLRMFNTTDDADDADRLYELYAVVVHIGGNAYHGHYVSVIKTKDRGWVLFDDEMVEPVDKHFVKNFFGDKPGMACAYVLFYQETTFENIRTEQEMEGLDEIIARSVSEDLQENGHSTGANGSTLARQTTAPISPAEDPEPIPRLAHALTAPLLNTAPPRTDAPPTPVLPSNADVKSKEDKKREKKEAEVAEKARKQQAKLDEKRQKEAKAAASKTEQEEAGKAADEAPKERESAAGNSTMSSFLSRSARGSKSMSKKSFGFLGKDKEKDKGEASSSASMPNGGEAHSGDKPEKLKERFTFGIGKKKSANVLS